MSKKLNKVLIPVIRELLPRILANDIVGVQPMTKGTGNILQIINNIDEWSEWCSIFSLLPRQSINGKWIFGRINKCGRWQLHRRFIDSGDRYDRIREHKWATTKELFTAKLKGTE